MGNNRPTEGLEGVAAQVLLQPRLVVDEPDVDAE